MPYKAIWHNLLTASAAPELIRSSHCVQSHAGAAYIFGGELKPRQPVPADILRVALDSGDISRISAGTEGKGPAPRVGPTWSKHGTDVYLFGGRGGASMEPLGTELWKYDLKSGAWEEVTGVKGEPPAGRSYHAAAVLGDDLYIHAGCPASGRLTTLDKYHIPTATWSSLTAAPGPPRGGTVLAAGSLGGKPVLLRFGGFGGPEFGELQDLAYYDPATNVWTTVDQKEGEPWPEPRSVHGFIGLPGGGPEVALLLMGEGKPAPAHLGHAGAGNFLSDVWVLSYDSTSGFSWAQAAPPQGSETPQGRGWFASDAGEVAGEGWGAVVSGGLNEKNERLGDVWILNVSTA